MIFTARSPWARKVGGHPVGSAPVLASYLAEAQQGWEGRTIIAEDGDLMGAAPRSRPCFRTSPALPFLTCWETAPLTLKKDLLKPGMQAKLGVEPGYWNPFSNLVGVVGNHEFDKGKDELLRRLYGGNFVAPANSNATSGPFLEKPWKGANYPTLAANVVATDTGKHILPPYVIKMVNGMPIGFIGVVLKDTPTMVMPQGVSMLTFTDEAVAINEQVQILKRQNVHAIVVLLHQGAFENSYTGPTPTDPSQIPPLTSADPLMKILNDLDDEVDVVITGHTHSFSNALVKNKNGATFLVTQAYSAGTAYGDIELGIDPRTRNVVSKSASIITTYADAGPGLRPDPAAASLVSAASGMVAPLTSQPVGTAAADLTRTQNSAGESPLGDLIADSQRAAMGTDFAFMNPGASGPTLPRAVSPGASSTRCSPSTIS